MQRFERTSRGFGRIEFTDLYDEPCSIQDSSIATIDAIWLGVDHVDPSQWASKGCDPHAIPARMHLTREMAAELITVLQRFVETGSIADE